MFSASTRTLNILAAVLWYSGAIVLLTKGTTLLLEAAALQPGRSWTWLTIALGLPIGWLKVKFIFRSSCKKNLMRIALLRDPKIWQFYRPGFLLFLAVMIIIGSTLSRMAHGNYPFLIVMTIVDFSLATALLGSSYVFWQQRPFKKKSQPENSNKRNRCTMSIDHTSGSETTNKLALEMPGERMRRLTIGWLSLALGSLVVGGLLTIVIVLSRTPYVQNIFPWVDLFHTALVVHVDLTVLVWFLGMAGVIWSINSQSGCLRCGWVALLLCAAGSVIISLSPFLGSSSPLMINYIPILNDPLFFSGLIMFGCGFLLLVLRGLFFSRPIGMRVTGQGALRFGLFSALISAMTALGALLASWLGIPESIQGEYYYELLFWGGGHTLQFVHIQLMLVCWLWLATESGIASRLTPRTVLLLFAFGLVPVLMTPVAYFMYDIASADHLIAMTWLMKFGGGLAALPISLVVLFNLVNSLRGPASPSPQRSALFSSMILFGVGGIIGFMIEGSNVTVPAHYHGSIVAVTLAYMGVTYHLLPLLGFRRPTGRLVILQPWIYASGQLMHVIGLAWSGGYGVQRKTAGDAQALDGIEQVAGMGLMGLGGLVAVVGGILFLVIVFKAMWPEKRASAPGG